MVANICFKTDIIVTSILHDIIEDTLMTKSMISDIFNQIIADNVEKLTKIRFNEKLSVAEMVKLLWLQGEYDLLIVKQFDRLHNMQTLCVKDPITIKKTVSETIEIFLILAVYLELGFIESQLTKLCFDFFPTPTVSDEFHRFLTAGENVQLLVPGFQSALTRKHNL